VLYCQQLSCLLLFSGSTGEGERDISALQYFDFLFCFQQLGSGADPHHPPAGRGWPVRVALSLALHRNMSPISAYFLLFSSLLVVVLCIARLLV